MKKYILLPLILVINTSAYAQHKGAETLLAYFSGSCKTSAQWTQTAMSDSNALIKTLTAIADDADCAGASGAISQLNSLSSQLATLDKLNDTQNSISTINAEEQELLVQLTKTSDPQALAQINATLRDRQLQRAKLLGDKSAEKLSGADKASVLAQIAQSANSSFQQITANQRCLEKNPDLLRSATSIMAGVGSAATLVNPAIGLSLSAGATFAKVAMDGIRNTRYSRSIRNISDSTVTFEAYSCALETMSERWCQMKDAESFLKFKAKHRRRAVKNPGLAEAISLNDREIPAMLDWLNRVRNGVAPRTTADAERRSVVLTRELIVRNKGDYGQSLIEQNRKTYESLEGKPDDQQWIFLRSLIMSLAPQYIHTTSNVKDPMTDIYTPIYSPYYLLGLKDDDSRIRNDQDAIYSFESWKKPREIIVTLDSVKVKYLEWVDRAANLVNRELTEVQQPDPLQTLSSANIESEPWMVTPLDAFQTVANFLEHNPPGEKQGDFTKIYQDTLEKLKKIHDIVTVAIATGDMTPQGETDLTPIEEVYDIGQLKYGIVVLQARLEMIVRLSLLEYIKNSPEEDQILLAQLLASDRFFETISTMNGTNSYAVLGQDIKKGQAYTMINLANFMDIFGQNINRTLYRLYNDEINSTPTVAQAYRDLRTSMCFLVLGAENAAHYINTNLCTGLKMEAREPGGPESITLGHDTFKKDLAERACTYREYFRESDIYQKWGIKN
jgi:hypothetical protein